MKTRKNSFPIFAIRLSELCKKTKTRLKTLAELGQVSLPSAQCWKIGTATPSYATLVAIARYFNISADYLLGLTDEPAPLNQTAPEPATIPQNTATASVAELQARVERIESQLARLMSANSENKSDGVL